MKIAEIQGLRGIAVLAVMLFHSQISAFHLGYLGVDIFFVISGFVVTWAVWPKVDAGRFSVGGFFVARIARLFPALFVVTMVVLVLSYRSQPLFEFRENLVDAIASLIYMSNFRFFLSLDYFAVDALHRPFTHFWSLGVEEQFYLAFPILVFAFRQPRLIAALTVASAVVYLIVSVASTAGGFYLPFGRAFQFLAGVALALSERRGSSSPAPMLIGGLIVGFVVSTAWNAVSLRDIDQLPFLATALAVVAIAYRRHLPWLKWSPLARVGDASYSAYLVHWPVVVFMFAVWPTNEPLGFAMYTGLSLTLAFLLHHGVELYVQGLYKAGRLRRFPLVVASLTAVAIPMGAYARLQSANTDDISDWALNLNAKMAETWRFSEGASGPFADDGKTKVLVVGDSTAKDFFNSLFLNAYPLDLRFQAVSHQCGISLDPPLEDTGAAANCAAAMRATLERIATERPDVVVVASYWEPFERVDAFAVTNQMKALVPHVIVVGPPVFYGTSVANLAYEQTKDGGSLNIGDINKKLSVAGRYDSVEIGETAASLGLPYVDRWDVLCTGLNCPVVTDEGLLIQSDKFHLTEAGAAYFGRRLASDPAMSTLLR